MVPRVSRIRYQCLNVDNVAWVTGHMLSMTCGAAVTSAHVEYFSVVIAVYNIIRCLFSVSFGGERNRGKERGKERKREFR